MLQSRPRPDPVSVQVRQTQTLTSHPISGSPSPVWSSPSSGPLTSIEPTGADDIQDQDKHTCHKTAACADSLTTAIGCCDQSCSPPCTAQLSLRQCQSLPDPSTTSSNSHGLYTPTKRRDGTSGSSGMSPWGLQRAHSTSQESPSTSAFKKFRSRHMELINQANVLRLREASCRAALCRALQLMRGAQDQYKAAVQEGADPGVRQSLLQCMQEAEEQHRAALGRVRECEAARMKLEEEGRLLREGDSH